MTKEVFPVNHPSNRLGELIFKRDGVGEVRKTRHSYFAWDVEALRGFQYDSESAAFYHLGLRRRTGYDENGFGENKLGRCVDKNSNGEIWKQSTPALGDYVDDYFVWLNDAEEAEYCLTLKEARGKLGIIAIPTTATLPKSAYAQNQKGYKAGSSSGKKG